MKAEDLTCDLFTTSGLASNEVLCSFFLSVVTNPICPYGEWQDEGFWDPELEQTCEEMLADGCDCQQAEDAWNTFLSTGELDELAACFYEETSELDPEVIDTYNNCIGSIDVESLPYAECIYCDACEYYEGDGELTQEEIDQFLNEVCDIESFTLNPVSFAR